MLAMRLAGYWRALDVGRIGGALAASEWMELFWLSSQALGMDLVAVLLETLI